MRKLTILFAILTLSAGLWADGSVFTYKATKQLTDPFASLGDVTYHEFDNGIGVVIYSNTVTTIGALAFNLCEDLQSITIPNGVTTIGNSAFAYSGLQSITIPNGVTTIGDYTFKLCQQLQSITLPASIITIEKEAFDGCLSLQSITLPAGVTTIGYRAFNGCSSFQSITLPNSVTTIGEEAFAYCDNLQEVTVAWTDATQIPTINANVFDYIADPQGPGSAFLYVPTGTKNLYQAKEGWNTFGYIGTPDEVLAKVQDDAVAAIDAAIVDVTDVAIIAIATKAKTDINAATTIEAVNAIKEKAFTDIALIQAKAAAVAEITTARVGIESTTINDMIDEAIIAINSANNEERVDDLKLKMLQAIGFYQSGKVETLGTMGEPCTNCTAVEVTDGTTTVTLYNATNVRYIKK